MKLARYEKDEKNLGVLSKLIRATVGPKFKEYLFNEHNPRKLLQILRRVRLLLLTVPPILSCILRRVLLRTSHPKLVGRFSRLLILVLTINC
jgi:hypothetical protein